LHQKVLSLVAWNVKVADVDVVEACGQLSMIVSGGVLSSGGATVLKIAVTSLLPFIVIEQFLPFMFLQPFQPRKADPLSSEGVNVIGVPLENLFEQSSGQLIPLPVTVPLPDPPKFTSRVKTSTATGVKPGTVSGEGRVGKDKILLISVQMPLIEHFVWSST
jgi:hypothetical protein